MLLRVALVRLLPLLLRQPLERPRPLLEHREWLDVASLRFTPAPRLVAPGLPLLQVLERVLRRTAADGLVTHLVAPLLAVGRRGLCPHAVPPRLLAHVPGPPLRGHLHPDAVAVHLSPPPKAPLSEPSAPLHHAVAEPPRLLLLGVRLRAGFVVAVGPLVPFKAKKQQGRLKLRRHRPRPLHAVLVVRLRRVPQLLGRLQRVAGALPPSPVQPVREPRLLRGMLLPLLLVWSLRTLTEQVRLMQRD